MNDLERQATIAECLSLFNANNIDELPDNALLLIIDSVVPPIYGGASTIYKESNKAERKALVADVKKCLANEAEITYQLVCNEGVRGPSTEEYFVWCSRHSVWYEITSI